MPTSRLPGAIASIAPDDIHVSVFAKALPVAQERFKTVLIITDDPGPKETRMVYGELSTMKTDFSDETATYRMFEKMLAQGTNQPQVEKVLVWSINRTAGEPITDWSNGLDNYVDENSLDFYYLLCTSRVPAEVVELASNAVTRKIMYFTSNYPGDRALISVDPAGDGSTELIFERRRFGPSGNGDRIKLTTNTFDGAATTTVTKAANGLLWDYTVNLANDGASTITADLDDIIAAVDSTAGITEFIKVKLGATATGSTTAQAEETFQTFAGGGTDKEGTDIDGVDLSNTHTRGETINHDRVCFWIHPDPETYWLEAIAVAFGSVRDAGAATFKNQRVIGVPEPNPKNGTGYSETGLAVVRGASMNTIFKDYNGRTSTTDDWTTAISYIDVQMKVDVADFLCNRSLWDLISPPPDGHGITYDDFGIGQVVNTVNMVIRELATPRRRAIATTNGEVNAEILWDDFRTIATGNGTYTSKADWQNRIFRLRARGTILHFIHEIYFELYLATDFVVPSLPNLN